MLAMKKKPMKRNDLTCDQVRRLFFFEAELGLLVWNFRPVTDFDDGEKHSAAHNAARWNTIHAGTIAGSPNIRGYRKITINGLKYASHRLIWVILYGEWPSDELDHIHGPSNGDVLSNLREATHQENSKNRKLPRTNTSGVIGVYWNKAAKKWFSHIYAMGDRIYLGRFSEKSHAVAARKAAEIQYGFHKNHGRKNHGVRN